MGGRRNIPAARSSTRSATSSTPAANGGPYQRISYPWRTVWGFKARWAAAGIVGQIRDVLAGRIRREMGKGLRAVATIIDSQSVKAASTVGKDSRGYVQGKRSMSASGISWSTPAASRCW